MLYIECYIKENIMPPKVKVTKEEIINTTIELVRTSGQESINARAIASSLNCSTQPIFSNFNSMEELEQTTILAAYEIYLNFIKNEVESNKYPKYKAFGMAYIRFAKDEKELFKLLFMRDRSGEEASLSPDFEESVKMIMQANNVSYETANQMHFELWACVHGLGTMLATSFMPLEWEVISDILSDVYQGIRLIHSSEVNDNVCN